MTELPQEILAALRRYENRCSVYWRKDANERVSADRLKALYGDVEIARQSLEAAILAALQRKDGAWAAAQVKCCDDAKALLAQRDAELREVRSTLNDVRRDVVDLRRVCLERYEKILKIRETLQRCLDREKGHETTETLAVIAANAIANRDAEIAALKAERDRYKTELESINSILRECGYGQGELDDDLAGCLRKELGRASPISDSVRSAEADRDRYKAALERIADTCPPVSADDIEHNERNGYFSSAAVGRFGNEIGGIAREALGQQ